MKKIRKDLRKNRNDGKRPKLELQIVSHCKKNNKVQKTNIDDERKEYYNINSGHRKNSNNNRKEIKKMNVRNENCNNNNNNNNKSNSNSNNKNKRSHIRNQNLVNDYGLTQRAEDDIEFFNRIYDYELAFDIQGKGAIAGRLYVSMIVFCHQLFSEKKELIKFYAKYNRIDWIHSGHPNIDVLDFDYKDMNHTLFERWYWIEVYDYYYKKKNAILDAVRYCFKDFKQNHPEFKLEQINRIFFTDRFNMLESDLKERRDWQGLHSRVEFHFVRKLSCYHQSLIIAHMKALYHYMRGAMHYGSKRDLCRYNFEVNKGYGTTEHCHLIKRYGKSRVHRKDDPVVIAMHREYLKRIEKLKKNNYWVHRNIRNKTLCQCCREEFYFDDVCIEPPPKKRKKLK